MQEDSVNTAFSKQASLFDKLDDENALVLFIRNSIRSEVIKYTKPTETMLELNGGTGLDALYFASTGLRVHTTDNADGMLAQMNQKINSSIHKELLSFQKCSFNDLNRLKKQTYHHVFSNFGGLNCAEDIAQIIKNLDAYTHSGSIAHLVIMPRYCLWELLFVLKGNFKLATRRFKKNGTISQVEGVTFITYYYAPSTIKRAFGNNYKTLSIKAMGCFIPPTYMDNFNIKHPKLFKVLSKLDYLFANKWPFYGLGDHYIISIQKK